MADAQPFLTGKSNLMNDFSFCQFINEEDDIDLELSMRKTNDRAEIEIQGEKERIPIRRRIPVTKSATTSTTKIPFTKPSKHNTTRPTITKSFYSVPPPPPVLGRSRIGQKDKASTPTLLIDPSTGASFHPDFMFCGACVDCKDQDESPARMLSDKINNNDLESNSDFESSGSDSSDNIDGFLRTTLQLKKLNLQQDFYNNTAQQQVQIDQNEILVLESLICAIPGVRKLSTDTSRSISQISRSPSGPLENIVVHHDASVLTTTLRHAFESAGYSASIGSTSTTEKVTGLTNISIAMKTSQILEGKSGMVRKEKGQVQNIIGTPSNETTWVRSSFRVEGICCTSEIPAIRKVLKPFLGIARVNVNPTTKIVHVQHNFVQIQASQISSALTKQGFPALIQKDGATTVQITSTNNSTENDKFFADTLDQIEKSPFVESTLTVEGLRPDQVYWIEKAISDSFIRVQVRAVYPSVNSQTIKVEHNPDLVSIEDIRDFLQKCSTNKKTSSRFPVTAQVYIDGAGTNLYLPSVDASPKNSLTDSDDGGCFSQMKRYHVNVVLSGIFWIFSMVSLMDGMDRFKYFGLASVFFGLPPILLKAYRTLKRFQFDANCMMVTAALGALLLGEYDEAASVSFLFAVSEFLEARASTKARRALNEICALRPDHANVIHPVSKEIIVVPADRVPLGSTISVRTGDKIVADGVVIEGSTSIDESSLTGESTPVEKKIGDEVCGGTINTGQTQLVIRTTTTVENSAVSRLIRLVEEAQSNRSPTEMMIDSFARSYTPSVIFIATMMCTVPWLFGTDVGRRWALNGLIIVVIACPCALSISTPVTYAAGLAATAKRGIVIKGGAKLEAMGSVDRIVFDKTGTLTEGKFSVTHMNVIGTSKTRKEMLELLSLMQERASHPIASSLVQAAKNEGVTVPRQMAITDHHILKGEGIAATIDGQLQVYVGNQGLFNRLGMFDSLSARNKNLVEEWQETGGTVGFIGSRKDGIIGMFCVKDSVRKEAREALEQLKEAGIETYMCTGDSHSTAQAVAKEIGILGHHVNSELLPEDKLNFVEGLKRPKPKWLAFCQKKQYVLFCGDGVNDAPALAAVDIGVSMGEGAAMALEMSDVTLMDSRLTKLPYVIQMGKRVLRTVKENIAISFVAKFTVVFLTFMGRMTLLYAIASDVGVMLLVTLNGMKLLPSNHFDENSAKRSRRRRRIVRQNNRYGKNVDFELVRMENAAVESTDSIDPDASEIV